VATLAADPLVVNASDLPPELAAGPAPAAPSRAEQLYVALSATNEAILRAGSVQELYGRVCDAAVGSGLLTVAAVMVPHEGDPSVLRAAAANGDSGLDELRLSVDEEVPEGRGLVGQAYRSRCSCVSQELLTDPRTAPWRQKAVAAGVQSGAAVPLVRDGRSVAVLLFYSPLRGAFDFATVRLLERMAENVCHALEGFEREAERARLAQELARFRAAIELSGDSIYLTDVETMRFIDVNETACQRLGYPREQLLTMGPCDVTTASRAQVEALFQRTIDNAPRTLVTEQTGVGQDGRLWMSEVSRRAMMSGGRWLIVTISRDIDERRRLEQLRALQLAVTRQLAATGEARPVLQAVMGVLGPGVGFDRGLCLVAADAGAGARRLASWQLRGDDAGIDDAGDARELALALAAPTGHIVSCDDGCVLVPLHAEGRTFGTLVLRGAAPSLTRFEEVLVAAGDQIGQYLRRKQAEEVLSQSEARFRSLTELSSDWYWESDHEFRFVSFGGRHLLDRRRRDWRDPFFGRRVWELPHLVMSSADFAAHRAQLERHERFHDFQFAVTLPDGSLRWTNASGEPFADADGRFAGYRGVSRDITDKRRAEESIRHLATHDTLTGLPNRALFTEALGQALREARHQGRRLALMFVDLDHFKIINDTLGHDAGDLLLAQMAQGLRDSLRAEDLVARLGGDEFVALVRYPAGADEVAVVARKLLAAASRPFVLQGQECRVSASVGICLYPDNADDEASLMKGADIAMYEAKRGGRNAYRFFSPDAPPLSLRRLRMESNLRGALERDELSLHFQPKVDLTSGRIIGAEALLRWHNAELGAVSPAEFIPLAEETGLMVPIGRWVLHEACRQHVAWRAQGLPPVPVAVNLSARQFADDELVPDIERSLAASGMAAGDLELEVTESVVVADPERALATLATIKRLGVRLAVDDFGTGYSSLAQLKRFPIDSLKIDRSFICGLPGDIQDVAITEAIVVMCRTLQLTVVAEGVETSEQREFLREHGCSQMQGFQFSRPLPPADFAQLVRRETSAATAASGSGS